MLALLNFNAFATLPFSSYDYDKGYSMAPMPFRIEKERIVICSRALNQSVPVGRILPIYSMLQWMNKPCGFCALE